MNHALPVFTADEEDGVQRLLALRVSQMMGRKLEEDDWSSVYCAAKNFPQQAWSNLNIDVIHGRLGVEHKMLCYRSRPSIMTAAGTTLMHPAATRSLRTGDLSGNPDAEMRNIFQQYRDLLNSRRTTVAIRGGVDPQEVDLRIGWLLWQETLREFLYFEEPMVAPDADNYYAEWVDKPDGKRKGSRNLWIYEKVTGKKRYSLTTAAGVKLQPYFDVPGAKNPNLYHWTVIGQEIDGGDVRVWLTVRTAEALRSVVGSLDRDALSRFVANAANSVPDDALNSDPLDDLESVVEVRLSMEAYKEIQVLVPSTNDDHLMQQLIDLRL